jgi:hypothetical protein
MTGWNVVLFAVTNAAKAFIVAQLAQGGVGPAFQKRETFPREGCDPSRVIPV